MDYRELTYITDLFGAVDPDATIREHIFDATLSRLWDLLNSKTCAIITAYRQNDNEGRPLSKKQNIERNRKLRTVFNQNKMGVYQLIGHWQEAPAGMDYEEAKAQHLTQDAIERSYVVPKPDSMSDEDFLSFMIRCMTVDGMTQDAFVYHNESGFHLVYNDGSTDDIGGNMSLNKIAQAYSQSVLKQDLPFVFDSTYHPNGNADRMAMKAQGLFWFMI